MKEIQEAECGERRVRSDSVPFDNAALGIPYYVCMYM